VDIKEANLVYNEDGKFVFIRDIDIKQNYDLSKMYYISHNEFVVFSEVLPTTARPQVVVDDEDRSAQVLIGENCLKKFKQSIESFIELFKNNCIQSCASRSYQYLDSEGVLECVLEYRTTVNAYAKSLVEQVNSASTVRALCEIKFLPAHWPIYSIE